MTIAASLPERARSLDSPRVQFAARDGFTLHGDLFEPAGPAHSAIVVAPAMAVNRGFYAAFASYLAEHGAAVLVTDYRGVGDSRPRSLRGMHATLHHWSKCDLEGALDFLASRYPSAPLRFVGHSIGGQLFGLLDAQRIDRAMLVASQSGYHGHWPWPQRARMLALWYAVVPGLSYTFGYFPIGRLTGSGEDVPKQIGLDWTRWARRRQYMFGDGPMPEGNCFAHFTGKLRAYAIMDDEVAPPESVSWLYERFERAQRELRRVHPRDIGAAKIGHFPAFRPAFRQTLWDEFRAFLSD